MVKTKSLHPILTELRKRIKNCISRITPTLDAFEADKVALGGVNGEENAAFVQGREVGYNEVIFIIEDLNGWYGVKDEKDASRVLCEYIEYSRNECKTHQKDQDILSCNYALGMLASYREAKNELEKMTETR